MQHNDNRAHVTPDVAPRMLCGCVPSVEVATMVPRGMYSASPGRRTTSMWGSPSCDAGSSCVWSFFP